MTSATREKSLTPKQTIFVEAVAAGKGHTEAARLAGYDGPTVNTIAYTLSVKPHVAHAITRARERYLATHEWSTEWWRGKLAYAMKQAEQAQDIPSTLRALELAGRHLGALEPTAPISPAAQTLLTMLAESMQRAQLPAPTVIEVVTENKVVTGAEEKS